MLRQNENLTKCKEKKKYLYTYFSIYIHTNLLVFFFSSSLLQFSRHYISILRIIYVNIVGTIYIKHIYLYMNESNMRYFIVVMPGMDQSRGFIFSFESLALVAIFSSFCTLVAAILRTLLCCYYYSHIFLLHDVSGF